MRILFLAQILPYPPNAGPRVKTWNVLRYLASRGHEVTLVAYMRADEAQYLPYLEKTCTAVHVIPMKRNRMADVRYWLRSHVTQRPFLIERDDHQAMRTLVRRLLAEIPFDVVHADQLTMTQFALDLPPNAVGKRPFTIFDAHNATWTISARLLENVPWFLKPVLRLETRRIQRYEAMLVGEFDHTMVVIDPDRDALMTGMPTEKRAATARRISVIPIAVDTDELQPVKRQVDSHNILTLGTLSYPPNADGIRWFLQEVFPAVRAQVPVATVTIVGKSPPADFLQLAQEQPDAVTVTGYVPDLTPYMEGAALMVVPVRAGSGMRVRLLEAFARSMPAVTTTIGLEGIEATPGEEVVVADSAAAFAQATIQLLGDPIQQQSLATKGRALAVAKYDWQAALRLMDAVYTLASSNDSPDL